MSTSTLAAGQSQEQQDHDPELDALLRKQGAVSVDEYFHLTTQTNRLIEFVDGQIEVLPMPASTHQAILKYLLYAFQVLVDQIGGEVLFAPLNLQISPGNVYRQLDLLLVRASDDPRQGEAYWTGADLVVEIVSPGPHDVKRDYDDKLRDYAATGINEYWIVDPQREIITVLRLTDTSYVEAGLFGRGDLAASALFADFTVSVDAVLDAGQRRPGASMQG